MATLFKHHHQLVDRHFVFDNGSTDESLFMRENRKSDQSATTGFATASGFTATYRALIGDPGQYLVSGWVFDTDERPMPDRCPPGQRSGWSHQEQRASRA